MRHLFFCIFSFVLLVTEAHSDEQIISGHFYLDKESIDFRIVNNNGKDVIIEGITESLRNAKFFCEAGNELNVHQIGTPDSKSFQNWTRLLGASPDGKNPGSTHRLIFREIIVSEPVKSKVSYITFVGRIILIDSDRRLLPSHNTTIRLEKM